MSITQSSNSRTLQIRRFKDFPELENVKNHYFKKYEKLSTFTSKVDLLSKAVFDLVFVARLESNHHCMPSNKAQDVVSSVKVTNESEVPI